MTAVERYNALDGQTVSREELQEISRLADIQGQVMISEKINEVLSQFEDPTFLINISETAIDRVPEDILPGLEYADTEEEFTGLEKAVAPDDIYQMITDKMLENIKEASGKGYKSKWKKSSGYLIPHNFVSKKPYRGINSMMLYMPFVEPPMKNPFFLTFNQIETLKGKLKKGSVGLPVVYFTQLYKYEQAEPELEFGTYSLKKMVAWLKKNRSKIPLLKKFSPESIAYQNAIPILKYYKVFKGEDVEGIDFDLENFKVGYMGNDIQGNSEARNEIADLIIKNYPKPQVPIEHEGERAYYDPAADSITLPPFENFETGNDYYRTAFHELIHSTGAEKRLNRPIKNKFGTPAYAKEELVAEFGSVFTSAHAGILWYNNTNHAEYLKNWSLAIKEAQEDNRFFMRAASKAQEAADYILNLDAEGVPAYQNSLKSESKTEGPEKGQNETPKKRKKAAFKKGDTAFYTEKGQNVTIRKVSIPKKGSPLEQENRVYDITYSNGRKAIGIAESRLEKARKEDPKPAKKQERKVKGTIERKKKGSRTFYIPTINGTRINKTNFARKSDAEKLLKATLNTFSDAELLKKIENFHKKQKDTRKDTNQLLEEQKKAKIQARGKADFEKGLKKLGFEIVSYSGDQRNFQEWKRVYKLNFKDFAGITLEMELEKRKNRLGETEFGGTSKIEGMGIDRNDYIYYEKPGEFYEETLNYLKDLFDMSLSEAENYKKEYGNTLFQGKQPKAQLGLFGTAETNDTILFNKAILQAKRTGIHSRKLIPLGKTRGILKDHLGVLAMTIAGGVITKAMKKDADHIAGWEHFINLPDNLNSPIAIFKSKSQGYVVVTELKNRKHKPLMAALHINEQFKITKIASLYARRNTGVYKKWAEEGKLIYAKEKSPFDYKPTPIAAVQKGSSKKRKNSPSDNKDTKKKYFRLKCTR